MIKFIETKLRTLSKTVVYRILCTIGVGLLALAIGASGAQAGTLALIALISGTILYYVHDRVWNRVNWRRNNQGEESVLRSVIKTIVYRILVMFIVVIAAKLVLTDDTGTAVAFAVGQFIINMVLYYVVERVANRIRKGRVAVEDSTALA